LPLPPDQIRGIFSMQRNPIRRLLRQAGV